MALAVGTSSGPGTRGRGAAAWLLDLDGFAHDFASLWDALEPTPTRPDPRAPAGAGVHPGTDRVRRGDTGPLRRAATRAWSSSDPAVVDHVARLAVTSPEEWMADPDDAHLGHWFRLVMATHLEGLAAPARLGDLREGLETLGWSPVTARRVIWGRDLAELAVAMGPESYGPAVALALGHGQRGWLAPEDLEEARTLLSETERARFRSVQDLLGVLEEWWDLLGRACDDGRPVVLSSSPSAAG